MLIARNARRIIDVSSHQGKINWEQVKYAGRDNEKDEVDGVIVRIGAFLKNGFDTELENNINGLSKYNIPYGVYLYSYAAGDSYSVNTPSLKLDYAHSGTLDARAIHEAIQRYHMNLTYPIYYDLEKWDISGNENWTYANYEPIINKFNEQMQAYGNEYGGSLGEKFKNWQIYASPSWMNQALNNDAVRDRVTWIAHYQTHFLGYNSGRTWNLNNSYKMWQYTSSDVVPGISKNVDSGVYGDFTYNPSQFK